MEKAAPVECESFSFNSRYGKKITMPTVISTAWSLDGKRVQIFVNASEEAQTVKVMGKTITVKGLDAVMIDKSK
jgi:hypothetical protein